jgi:HK97 family phage major capsid protein
MQTKIDEVLNVIKSQADEIAEMRDALESVKSAPAVQVEVKDEKAELKAKFYNDVKNGSANTQVIKDGQVKSFNTADQASAGAGIVTEVSQTILTRLRDDYVVAGLFGVETASSVDYEKRVQVGHSTVAWVGENVNADGVAMTGTPTFETVKMTHGKISAAPVLTSEALSDPFFNAEAFVMQDVAVELSRGIALGILKGEGKYQPKGFYKHFDATEGAKPVADRAVDAFPVVAEDIADDAKLLEALRRLPYKMPASYVVGGKYVMTRELFERVSGLKDGIGRHYMHESEIAGVAGRIFGYDIVIDPMNTNQEMPVVFGHLDRAFKIVNIPTALELVRNPYAIPHCVRFDVQHRVGTIVGDNQAVIGLVAGAASRKAK